MIIGIFLGNIKVSLIKYSVKFDDIKQTDIYFFFIIFFSTGKSGSLLFVCLFKKKGF